MKRDEEGRRGTKRDEEGLECNQRTRLCHDETRVGDETVRTPLSEAANPTPSPHPSVPPQKKTFFYHRRPLPLPFFFPPGLSLSWMPPPASARSFSPPPPPARSLASARLASALMFAAPAPPAR